MDNINPDIIVIGLVGAALTLFLSAAFIFGILSPANKVMRQRLGKLRTRYSPKARNKSAEAARRLLIHARDSELDDFLKRILPRPAELRQRLNRTGHAITLGQYAIACVATVVIATIALLILTPFAFVTALLFGVVVGIGLPHMVVGHLIRSREEKFIKLFPEAIDLIVRGLKSGLPVTESINAVGREMADPVGVEFRRMGDDVRLGKTLNEALWAAANRLSTPELKFFVISLSVQQETGGNLAETLGNLSTILRAREQMRLKIRAMSSEGRASAMIIGGLPFIMFAMIMLVNPDYGSVLLTDPRGQTAAAGAMLWMGVGMLMIKKMISFEI